MELTLNGNRIRVDNISPNSTLLEFLRDNGLTGAKEGCAEGDCGACSVVLIDRDSAGRPAYRAVNSCLMPVCLVAGRSILTVEGIGCSAKMHPVQEAMAAGHGSQCGYCTPGFICSLFEGFYRSDLRTGEDLDEQLAGNLCRCTGYRAIRDAALEAFARRAPDNDLFASRLRESDPALDGVHYEFGGERFFRPCSLSELLRVKKENPSARLIAGATELGLDITKRFRKFAGLISTEAVPELKRIERASDVWRIGAAVTLTDILDCVGGEYPFLADMLRVFGSRQIRNRATMGGNIVAASPIGDCAPVLLALDARVVLVSAEAERNLPMDEFFTAYRKTALREDEILKTIIIPRTEDMDSRTRRSAWHKVSKRREMDISTVAAAMVIDLDGDGVVRHARLAYGGVAATPARARKTEALLLGQRWDAEIMPRALAVLRTEFAPITDVRGSAEYRAGLITGLFEKFFADETQGPPATKAVPSSLAGSRPLPHESAHKHVTGEAIYTDDVAARKDTLETWLVVSPHARARILRRDASVARQMPGIAAVLLAEDVPGRNDVGAVRQDEILLADQEVFFHGQIIALVVGETQELCRAAAEKVVVEYEPLQPILKIEEAIAAGSFHTDPNFIRRGDLQAALAQSPHILEGELAIAGQEHFYLETQAAWAEAGEDGALFVMSSTQHPSEVQQIVAHLLDVPASRVVVQCPRLGGGFGGKETQAATFAALAALGAAQTQRPVRVRINRDIDMMLTGKRHPFLAKFNVGYNDDGDLLGARIELISNGGWSLDLSMPVTDRALFHLDNCYFIPAVEFSGRVAKTNLASNTAFRGFGGPQGMLVIEEILDRVARRVGKAPEEVRERNLYRGRGETNTTHYGQELEDNRPRRIWGELKTSSRVESRREEIARWNARHPHRKRGLAMTPVKFGISFTVTHLNQAGALVHIFQDGSVQVNHGATEMGQGVHTNIRIVAATELGVPLDAVRVMPTSTDKVPNTSATAASCGTDLNGMAVKNACEILRARLAPVAQQLMAAKMGGHISSEQIIFAEGLVFYDSAPQVRLPFADVIRAAYLGRVSLSSTGYYRTPGIHYDRAQGRGKPFHYFAVGAAVAEVEVDGFTGMTRTLRVDILHDAGESINRGVNLGQIEGGFVQGAGWLTGEELVWDDAGRLLTHSPDTYKIPAIGDRPLEWNVQFLTDAAQRNTIMGSKAVGEPPLMLAISVREAIRDAIAAFGCGGKEVPLGTPATPEAVWIAIRQQRAQAI